MMGRNLNLDKRAIILVFGSGAGTAWGLASLLIGFSQVFANSSGIARWSLSLIALPFSAAIWLRSDLGLNGVDPAGLTIATGTLGGFAFTLSLLILYYLTDRIRDRWRASTFQGPLP